MILLQTFPLILSVVLVVGLGLGGTAYLADKIMYRDSFWVSLLIFIAMLVYISLAITILVALLAWQSSTV